MSASKISSRFGNSKLNPHPKKIAGLLRSGAARLEDSKNKDLN